MLLRTSTLTARTLHPPPAGSHLLGTSPGCTVLRGCEGWACREECRGDPHAMRSRLHQLCIVTLHTNRCATALTCPTPTLRRVETRTQRWRGCTACSTTDRAGSTIDNGSSVWSSAAKQTTSRTLIHGMWFAWWFAFTAIAVIPSHALTPPDPRVWSVQHEPVVSAKAHVGSVWIDPTWQDSVPTCSRSSLGCCLTTNCPSGAP